MKDEAIKQLYKSGLTQREVAKELKVSPNKVSAVIKEAGLSRSRGPKVSDEQKLLVRQLIEQALSRMEIFRKTEVSLTYIDNVMRGESK